MIVKIPSMILTPYIGVFVERINKKKGLVVSDFISGTLFIMLSILLLFGKDNIIVFIVISAIYQVVSSVFSISSTVLFTHFTTDENRLKINSYKSVLDNVSWLIAPTLGAVLFFIIGMEGIVIINAISFIISAILELFIKNSEVTKGEKKVNRTQIKEYKEVYNWLKLHRGVLGLLVVVMILNFFVAPNDDILFPAIVVRKLGYAESVYGISVSVFLVGNIIASMLLSRIESIRDIALRKLFIINSSVLVMIGLSANFIYNISDVAFLIIYLVSMLSLGFITTLINIPIITEFQTKVPKSMQGRFFALLSLNAHLLIPLGLLYAGISSELIGPSNTIIINNIIVIVFVFKLVKIEKKLVKKS